MLSTKLKSSLVAISVATILSACGGGSGGAPTGSTSTNVTSSGTITEFGSVYVNGVRYDSRSAVVKLEDGTQLNNGQPMDDSTLRNVVGEGNIVKVRGTRNDDGITGTANTITIDNELVGPIEAGSINDDTLTFVVNGQTISVTPDTFIDDSIIGNTTQTDQKFSTLTGTTLSALLNSVTTVEISGFPNGSGIEATRIEDDNSTTAGTGGTNTSDDLLDNDFSEGEVEVEGIITVVDNPPGTITINNIELPVTDVTQFSVGMHVEIKATLQNGNLLVTRVKNEAEDTIRIEVMADAAPVGGVITNDLGLDIIPTDRTRFEGGNIGDIDNTTHIEARGFPHNNGILWTRIEISNDVEARCRLRGPVSAFDETNSEITIEGVVVDTSGSQYEDANDQPIAKPDFFALLDTGTIVQAKSRNDGSGCNFQDLTAKEVSLEPEDDVLVSTGGVNGGANDEITASITAVSTDSFVINGETVGVNDNTVIDDSIVEDARGVELQADSFLRSELSETLSQLLKVGSIYNVTIDRSSGSAVATSIEDL